ncbi:MAG: Bax inhibitor-1/YccA family protein [Bacteroidales bacterium]|nr:Bax inhibitor-1/YccA family protein [Bacteroidales bacterium]MDY2916937.1 Bax inhibitor-1/YccA family protein [Muribaculaceae bacterium]
MDYNNSYETTYAVSDTRVSSVMKRVYLIMTVGLALTGVLAYVCGNSFGYLQWFANNSWAFWVMAIGELAIVFGVSAGINKISTATATALFVIFAALNGLMLAPIFLAYTHVMIAKTFFITAGVFGAMSIYGYSTDRDLSKFGSFLMMALFGLIIAMLVNIFLKSSTMDWIISIVGVLIFVGLTAWDTQQVKNIAAVAPQDTLGRLAVLGALNLYLDFINLFLYLLRIFGGSSRD